MATKSRARAKSGAAPGAPKPKIEPRKTPLMRRKWFRRAAAAVLAVLALWIALFVWGRVSRSSALRSYNKKLYNAALPFLQDIQQGTNSIQQAVADFKAHTVNSKALSADAARWATDFNAAATAIAPLKPPGELKGAQQDLIIALADYFGVAQLYGVVGKQSDLADSIPLTLALQKQAAVAQLTLLLQRVSDAQSRADATYTAAINSITELSAKWHVKVTNPFPPAPSQSTPQQGSGLSPNPTTS
ncbi:MAG TPA: hypothetical protein VGW79_07940 [Actinomycetota bacterium]|nr:hypothetical protein [Actinomycetota bacterium]